MNVNHTFRSLDIGLPEDILRRKLYGDFDGAQRLIALRLADPDLPQALRDCLTAQSEMIRRLPGEYPYTRTQALERLRANIPDFTEEELTAGWTGARSAGSTSMVSPTSSAGFSKLCARRSPPLPSGPG